jgi:hypothetical protein
MSRPTSTEPRELAVALERNPGLPTGTGERFSGYGIMGLPFASGHVLALWRFPSSSIGPGYTSVWHRDPAGRWTFYADVAPRLACARFFGPGIERAVVDAVRVTWTGARSFVVTVPSAGLAWAVHLGATPVSRLLNAAARALPQRTWRNPRALAALGLVMSRAFDLGRLSLSGSAPNGQRFRATPRVVWPVEANSALLGGESLGPVDPQLSQSRLGDFWIPRRGVFVVSQAFFEGAGDERAGAIAQRDAGRSEAVTTR